MYNPLRYIDPSGWAPREPGNGQHRVHRQGGEGINAATFVEPWHAAALRRRKTHRGSRRKHTVAAAVVRQPYRNAVGKNAVNPSKYAKKWSIFASNY